MKSTIIDDEDRYAPANQYWEMELHEKKEAEALEAVRWLVRHGIENDPEQHRTGSLRGILKTAAKVLTEEKGWHPRQAVDALVLEAVRAGSDLEAARRAKK